MYQAIPAHVVLSVEALVRNLTALNSQSSSEQVISFFWLTRLMIRILYIILVNQKRELQ